MILETLIQTLTFVDLFQIMPPQQIIHKTFNTIKGNSDNRKGHMTITHFIEEVVQQQ